MKNIQASIRQRLLNMAREKGENLQLLLTRYGLERLLYRLVRSRYRGEFVLKGAFLFFAWGQGAERPTRDIDLLGYGPPDISKLEGVFHELCGIDAPGDGLEFLEDSIRGEAIREEAIYDGIRLRMESRLGNARIDLQVDVGFGDKVYPAVRELEYPVLLDHDPPRILVYPPEAVVAEKVEAMVSLGAANSRMKDFHDVWKLAGAFPFLGLPLSKAISTTFQHRGTKVPDKISLISTTQFTDSSERAQQWRAFCHRTGLSSDVPEFEKIIDLIQSFLVPLIEALSERRIFEGHWPPGGPWIKG